MRKTKYLVCLLLALLLVAPTAALANTAIDMAQPCALTLSYMDGEVPVVGAHFDLYKVAGADASGALSVTDEFSAYSVMIGSDADSWRTLASTLEGYVLRDKLTPADSGETDKNGELTFPGGDKTLSAGLYLVTGARHTQAGRCYDAMPFVVMLPSYDEAADEWHANVTAAPKFESDDETAAPDTVSLRVLKVWNSGDAQTEIPDAVSVQLLRDGEVYDTVQLDSSNSWRYEWTGLDNSHTLRVVELTPAGYTVEIEREDHVFVITNTPSDDSPPGPTPMPAPTPTPTPDKPKLPQTGQLWWPVPLLMACGLLCLIVGAAMKRAGRHD